MAGRRKGRPIQVHLVGQLGWEGWQLVTLHLYHPEHVKSFRTGRGPYERKPTHHMASGFQFDNEDPRGNVDGLRRMLQEARAWWRKRVLGPDWQGIKARRKAYRGELRWWYKMVGAYLPIVYYQRALDTEIQRLQKRWGITETEQE